MRIRLLILTLLIIGVHQHIQAQYMLGTTGMMNIPTADRQKPGTVMLGGNYLPKQMMPARFDYNTGNYFVSISFFSFLELAYRETLIKGDYISSKPKYNQQDRSYSIRLCVWKEGKFLPGIALGANDPIADKGATTCGTRMSSTRQKINLCKNRNTRLSNRLIVWYLHFCCY